MHSRTTYCILGQGIAGTTLALSLLQLNEQVRVFDDGYAKSSSMAAAGLWNPIVFRRINLSWMAAELIAELQQFYPAAEQLLHAHFFHPKKVYRIHSSALEARLWKEKKALQAFEPFLGPPATAEPALQLHSCPYGASWVEGAGYLDVQEYLNKARAYFTGLGIFERRALSLCPNAEELVPGLRPEAEVVVIDCRGTAAAASPWWSYLPWGLTKGEILELHAEALHWPEVLNAGFFFFNYKPDTYLLGSTFDWQHKDWRASEAAKEELLRKWKSKSGLQLTVSGQRAGVRPTVQDRRPLIGLHPVHKKLGIFNGLGTKGVMLAPLLSRLFAERLRTNKALPPETDIARFEHLLGQAKPTINYPVA